MAEQALKGMSIAILATDGFEQSELLVPRKALVAAGASTKVVSLKSGALRGWNHKQWATDEVAVDLTLDETGPEQFDALLLPGGVLNPDSLRTRPKPSPSSRLSSTPASRWAPSAMGRGS